MKVLPGILTKEVTEEKYLREVTEERYLSNQKNPGKGISEKASVCYLIWTIAFYVFFIDLAITLPSNIKRIDVALENFKGSLLSNEDLGSKSWDLLSAFSKLLFQSPPWDHQFPPRDQDTRIYLVRDKDLISYQDGDQDTGIYLVREKKDLIVHQDGDQDTKIYLLSRDKDFIVDQDGDQDTRIYFMCDKENLIVYQDRGDILNWVTILRIMDFICIGLGIWHTYRQNGREGGFHFIQKFAVLSWAVGIQFLFVYAFLRFCAIELDILGLDKYGAWIDIILLLGFYFYFYKCMGRSIARTKQSDSNQSAKAENAWQSGARDV